MRKVLKWIGLILGGLVVLLLLAGAGLTFAGSSRLNKSYQVRAEPVTISSDAAALARGEHLVDVFCRDCHTADLTGQPFFDEAPIGTVYASNLTGLAETHTDEDLLLAIRHGLDREGRPLLIMPAESFVHFSQEDLGAVIAYLKSLPRTGEPSPEKQFRPVGRIMTGAGFLDSAMPATYIDHESPFPAMPEVGANVAYGEYLSRFCQSCHGEELAGGRPPAPNSPPGPNLTPNGALGSWTEEEFVNTMRTGITPNGRQLNSEYMPWKSIGKLEEDELRALWIYLESLPPRATAIQ